MAKYVGCKRYAKEVKLAERVTNYDNSSNKRINTKKSIVSKI